MEIRELDDDMAVSGQIAVGDVPALLEAGYSMLLCNRPDGEEPDQPGFAEIAEAARAAGIDARHIPMSREGPSPELIRAFADALGDAARDNGKVLAYCRTGTRSCALWGLAEARRGRDAGDIISRAASRGYDLGPMLGTPR